jgi:tape measure domain-containing protein
MASNDLMMRIQLLVESGRASNDLLRIQKSIEGLTKSIKSLENTRIAPLVRDIDAIKVATAGLRGVNIGNFAAQLNSIKTAFTGLGVPTQALDDLRAKYTALNAAVSAGTLKNFQNDLARVKNELLQSNSAIVPLQNNIRSLRAQKGIDKSLGVDTLNSNLRIMRAELALAIDKYKELARTKAPKSILDTALADIRQLNRDILKGNLDVAKGQKTLFDAYDKNTAQLNQQIAKQRNISSLRSDEIKQINAKIATQKAYEQSLNQEIKQLTGLANAQANARRLQLQSDLSATKGTRTGLQSRVRELEAEARAEIQRIRATDQGTRALNRQGQQVSALGQLLKGNMSAAQEFGAALRFAFGPQMAGFATAGGIYAIVAAFAEANREVEKLLRGLNAITGGQGDVYFERLSNSAAKLGLPIRYVSQSFLALNAATKNTSLEGLKTQELFEALGNALSTTGANAVQFERGFRAIGQILSKDQLFAEELRQQLGEQLPTAIQDFARALKITPADLFKFMEQGVIKGEELRRTIVLVSKEWKNTFKVLDRTEFTVDQKLALLQNQMLLLFKTIGDTGVWRAFGDSILYVEGLLSDAKNGVGGLAAEIVALSRTIVQFASDVKNDLGGLGDDIGNSLNNVEFSPAGLIRNFKVLFQALPNEARTALQPIEDAVGGIDFGKIVVGAISAFQALGQGIGIFIAQVEDSFKTLGTQIQLFDQVPVQFMNVVVAGIKVAFTEAYEFILTKINDIKFEAQLVALEIKKSFKDAFGTQAGVDAVIAEIKKLEDARKASNQVIEDTSKVVDDSYNNELAKLKQLTTAIANEGTKWSERTKNAFSGIIDTISKNFERLNINREIERQNILLQQAGDRERQRALFHKEYIDNLRAEARARNPLLIISKEQAKLEQDRLKLSQAYNDSLLEVNASQYKRWADQGQITQEAAAFFEKSAKSNAAYKAWTQAQDAVDKYNEEVKKGAGANAQEASARKETLDALRQQASEQLAYASSKAREIGDANRLKQVYEQQTGLIESQANLSKDIQKVLKNAEIQTGIVSPTEENVKTVINDTQNKLNFFVTLLSLSFVRCLFFKFLHDFIPSFRR